MLVQGVALLQLVLPFRTKYKMVAIPSSTDNLFGNVLVDNEKEFINLSPHPYPCWRLHYKGNQEPNTEDIVSLSF